MITKGKNKKDAGVSARTINTPSDNLSLWGKIKRQKYGWFTMLFYGIGNVFWAYAGNFRAVAGARNNVNPTISAVAGGFWITVIREFFYVLLFILYAGPNLIKRRFKDTWTLGGRWMLFAVFVNFIGNVFLAIGYIYLVTAAFAGSIETSFIIFTFIGTYLIFGQKYNKWTWIGMLILIGFLVGITVVQVQHLGGIKDKEIGRALTGAVLVALAQLGYMAKNIIGEYVFKHKLLDTEGVQFMATFWSPFIALVGTLVFLPILQPILAATASTSGNPIAYEDVSPYMMFVYMLRYWEISVVVLVASVFLLTGRNCQYQNTRVSGASLSNTYYQAKLIVQTLGTVIAYAIVIGISNTKYPVIYDNTSTQNVWSLLTTGTFSLWYYWVLLLGLVGSVVFTCVMSQKHFEINQKQYRKERNIKDEEIDYSITNNVGISRGSKAHLQNEEINSKEQK